MAAFVIGVIDSVNDPEGFVTYQEKAGPTLARYGGQVITGGSKIEVADGTWSPTGVVVIGFENIRRAKAWYNSPEYSEVRLHRFEATTSSLIFLDEG